MPTVAPVRLTYNPRILWFDPQGIEFGRGDALIVKTERGLEYGVANDAKEVDEVAISSLKSPLKPVIRKATPEDMHRWKEAQQAAHDALPVFKEMVSEQGLDMHPIAVEFLFDGDKAIFYFEAEERVDFRKLVRALASRFHKRIDMRQIGVRDEARIVGGFGHCGQELCCKRLGGEFKPVSIRMAKDQDLSLNPQKISGVCGRLMCCLRYEDDVYKEFKGRCPKLNSTVSTPMGDAKVCDINVPREMVTLLVDDKQIKVPVSEMDTDPKTGKPSSVSQEVLDECRDRSSSTGVMPGSFASLAFTGADKLADIPAARSFGSSAARGCDSSAARSHDSSTTRRSQHKTQGSKAADATAQKQTARKRRSHLAHGIDVSSQDFSQEHSQHADHSLSKKASSKVPRRSQQKRSGANRASQQKKQQESRRTSMRPGMRSSSLANSSSTTSRQNRSPGQAVEHRKTRRRSHKAQGGKRHQG